MVNDNKFSHINACGLKYDLIAAVLFCNFGIIMLITEYIWR